MARRAITWASAGSSSSVSASTREVSEAMGPYSTRMRRASRFVILEGIMGAGKTTTGKWLAERLGGRFLEEGPTHEEPVHPLRVNSKLAHPMAVWEDVSAEEYAAFSLRLWRQV